MTSVKSSGTPAAIDEKTVVGNGLMLVGDMLFPGTSLLLEGRVKEGVTHSALGWVGKAVFGPIGWVVVAADSFSQATTNKGLTEHLFGERHHKSHD